MNGSISMLSAELINCCHLLSAEKMVVGQFLCKSMLCCVLGVKSFRSIKKSKFCINQHNSIWMDGDFLFYVFL